MVVPKLAKIIHRTKSLGYSPLRGNIHTCKLFASFLDCSSKTAAPNDVRSFQRHLLDSGKSIQNRSRIMTGVKFLLKVRLARNTRRLTDLSSGLRCQLIARRFACRVFH